MRDVCGSAFEGNISKTSRIEMVWFGLSGIKRQGGYRVMFLNERKRKERGEAASVRVAN